MTFGTACTYQGFALPLIPCHVGEERRGLGMRLECTCSVLVAIYFILQPTKCGKMAQDVGIVESIVVSFPSSLVGF